MPATHTYIVEETRRTKVTWVGSPSEALEKAKIQFATPTDGHDVEVVEVRVMRLDPHDA